MITGIDPAKFEQITDVVSAEFTKAFLGKTPFKDLAIKVFEESRARMPELLTEFELCCIGMQIQSAVNSVQVMKKQDLKAFLKLKKKKP